MPSQPNPSIGATEDALFYFTLDSFQIMKTRALHQDTDYVTFTLLVQPKGGTGTPQTLNKAMGNVNNGVYPVSLSFSNVPVTPTDTVTLNYLIVNSGHTNPSQIESILESAATKLAVEGATAVGNAIIPGLGSALGVAANYLATELISIITANCDGPVAAEQDTFTYSDLIAKAVNGPFSQSTTHPGTSSAVGCGGNSLYSVNWHMLEVGNPANKTVPNVLEMPAATAATQVRAAGLVAKFTGDNTAHALVFSQSPTAGQIVDQGATVTMDLRSGIAR